MFLNVSEVPRSKIWCVCESFGQNLNGGWWWDNFFSNPNRNKTVKLVTVLPICLVLRELSIPLFPLLKSCFAVAKQPEIETDIFSKYRWY